MKKVVYVFFILFLLNSCTAKQYFNTSPEIEVIKKASNAYYKGDWKTLKTCFKPDAGIWFNTPKTDESKLSTDRYIEFMQADLANFSEYGFGKSPEFENPVYEMVIDNEGNKWVHVWMTWTGKTKNGRQVVSPLHISSQVKEDKIASQLVYFNALPAYLALQQPDSSAIKN